MSLVCLVSESRTCFTMYRCIVLCQTIMWVICQIPSRCCFYIRTNKCSRFIFLVLLLLFYCEFLHYYLVLLFCTWPSLTGKNMVDFVATETQHRPLKAMFIADTHILGFKDGHWFDKLRREWQMERSFQTAMMIHSPDVVFILGDLLDEGKWCSQLEFQYHVSRFRKMFQTPTGVNTEILVGNHDVGFHYMMSEQNHRRFEHAFDAPAVRLLEIKGNLFVMLNSMAMEGDGCKLCSEAVEKLEEISWQLKCAKGETESRTVASICESTDKIIYSQPILLQHFPMYRPSDANCSLPDAAPVEEKEIPFREKWDCLSKEATQQLFDWINPRLIISGHTHHGCYRIHDDGTPEWTVSSFSWRNKKNPTFLLAVISNNDFSISQCFLPHENTVITIYVTGILLIVFSLLFPRKSSYNGSKRETTQSKFN